MKNIRVSLLNVPLAGLVISGARTCYDSFDKRSEEKDKELLKRLWQNSHHSIFEHLVFTFYVENCSRLILQEIVRHRIASYSVKSTRFTLKKFVKELEELQNKDASVYKIVEKFCVVPEFNDENIRTQYYSQMLNNLLTVKSLIQAGVKNDLVKYFLPESFRTTFVWTINFRSLANFLKLRLSHKAHFEIRYIAYLITQILKNCSEWTKFLLDILELEEYNNQKTTKEV